MKNFKQFAEDLGKRESGGDYKVVNKWGFLGKYQFGKRRIYDLGYSLNGWHPPNMAYKKYISKETFLNSPELQEELFKKHVLDLKKTITKKFSKYFGTIIDETLITLSGLVAGAHLLGIGGVSAFLKGEAGSDALGTNIKEYIDTFANYDLNDIS